MTETTWRLPIMTQSRVSARPVGLLAPQGQPLFTPEFHLAFFPTKSREFNDAHVTTVFSNLG